MPRRLVKLWIWDELPLPKKVRSFPAMKHPLHQMLKQLEIGECFDWPRELKAKPNNLMAIMRVHERVTKKKFRFRTIYPKGNLTYRIWRTA